MGFNTVVCIVYKEYYIVICMGQMAKTDEAINLYMSKRTVYKIHGRQHSLMKHFYNINVFAYARKLLLSTIFLNSGIVDPIILLLQDIFLMQRKL